MFDNANTTGAEDEKKYSESQEEDGVTNLNLLELLICDVRKP